MCKIPNKRVSESVEFAEDNKLVTKRLDIVTERVVKYMIAEGMTLSTAESCTGGLLSQLITSVPGASEIFTAGLTTYTEEMKMKILGVKKSTLDKWSVYSAQTASEMSLGAARLTGSQAAIGVTGIAGPSGGSEEKPVGTVYVSVRLGGRELVRDLALYKEYEDMDRKFIRQATALKALEMLEELVNPKKDED